MMVENLLMQSHAEDQVSAKHLSITHHVHAIHLCTTQSKLEFVSMH